MYDHLRPDRGLPSIAGEPSDAEHTWAGDLRRAADWLALGSACLFLVVFLFPGAWLVALALHGVGWYFLGAGALRAPGNALRSALATLFAASLAAFAFAFLIVVPGEPGILPFLFPLLPEVWVPVVACHAALFLLAGSTTRDRGAAGWIVAGSVVLAVLVSGGALVWTLGVSQAPSYVVLLLPGLTALGYVVIRIGLRRLDEDVGSGLAREKPSQGPLRRLGALGPTSPR